MKIFEVDVTKALKSKVSREQVFDDLNHEFIEFYDEDYGYVLSGFYTGIKTGYPTNSYLSPIVYDNVHEICEYLLGHSRRVWYGYHDQGFYFRAKKGLTEVLHAYVLKVKRSNIETYQRVLAQEITRFSTTSNLPMTSNLPSSNLVEPLEKD